MEGNLTSRAASMKPIPVPSQYSVRATIAALLHHGDASLQHTAYRLGISPRSLQRYLTQMGTSYSEVVAQVRLDTACHLLAESDQSISSIAFLLGYSGASSFTRTFRRLMNIQPIVYRRQEVARMKGRTCGDSEHSARPDKFSRVERLARNGKPRRRVP
jgi:AraC-like DNA-binding protein